MKQFILSVLLLSTFVLPPLDSSCEVRVWFVTEGDVVVMCTQDENCYIVCTP
jgi:hypothetical protein